MLIKVENLTKRYQYRPVFNSLNLTIEAGQHVAVTGSNGSGKSTFLKIVSGFLTPSEGNVRYFIENQEIKRHDIWKYLAFTAPYIDLMPSFTVREYVNFQSKLRPLRSGYDLDSFLELVRLDKHSNKSIDNLSSGMRQRLKLGLCMITESQLLILDEPGTTLDEDNHAWFIQCMQFPDILQQTCLIASNEKKDLVTCEREISMQ